jgi:hypothetical protein
MVDEESITICHHEDGSDFLLGQGSFGEARAPPPNNPRQGFWSHPAPSWAEGPYSSATPPNSRSRAFWTHPAPAVSTRACVPGTPPRTPRTLPTAQSRAACRAQTRAARAQVYKALRNNVQECAVKRLRNVNKTELANFQRVRGGLPPEAGPACGGLQQRALSAHGPAGWKWKRA